MTEHSSTESGALVLGIESSCDETGVALFDASTGKVVAEALHSQVALHAPYGGVVPELASRDHITYGLRLIDQVLTSITDIRGHDVKAVAYTQGQVGRRVAGRRAIGGESGV